MKKVKHIPKKLTQKNIRLNKYVSFCICLGAGLLIQTNSVYASHDMRINAANPIYAEQKPAKAQPKLNPNAPSSAQSNNILATIEAAYDAIKANSALLPTNKTDAENALRKIANWRKLTPALKTFADNNGFGNSLLKNVWEQYRMVDGELKTALAAYYGNIGASLSSKQALPVLKSSLEKNLVPAYTKLMQLIPQLQKEQFSSFFESNKKEKIATKQLLLTLISKLQAAVAAVTNKTMMAHANATKAKTAIPTATQSSPIKTAPGVPALNPNKEKVATLAMPTTPAKSAKNTLAEETAELQHIQRPGVKAKRKSATKVAFEQPNTKTTTTAPETTNTPVQATQEKPVIAPESGQIQEAETLKKQLNKENSEYSDHAWREYKREYDTGSPLRNDRDFYDAWKKKQKTSLEFYKKDPSKQHITQVYEDFLTQLTNTENTRKQEANKLKQNLETINNQLKKSAQSGKSGVWGNWGNEAQTKYDNWLQTQREKMATALNNKQEHLVKVYKAFFDTIKKSL